MRHEASKARAARCQRSTLAAALQLAFLESSCNSNRDSQRADAVLLTVSVRGAEQQQGKRLPGTPGWAQYRRPFLRCAQTFPLRVLPHRRVGRPRSVHRGSARRFLQRAPATRARARAHHSHPFTDEILLKILHGQLKSSDACALLVQCGFDVKRNDVGRGTNGESAVQDVAESTNCSLIPDSQAHAWQPERTSRTMLPSYFPDPGT